MLNHVVLVGRIAKEPELKEFESGKKATTIRLAVTRGYKNMDGIYETDFVDCVLWEHIAKNTIEYCHKGDLIAIKGRIQTRTIDYPDNKKMTKLEIVAEKVNFLTNKKAGE